MGARTKNGRPPDSSKDLNMSTCSTCGGTGTIGESRRLDPLTGRTVSKTKIPCRDCS